MALARQQELLALALHIEKTEGENGPRYITERIGAAVMGRDAEQIDFWKGVAAQYEGLLKNKKSKKS